MQPVVNAGTNQNWTTFAAGAGKKSPMLQTTSCSRKNGNFFKAAGGGSGVGAKSQLRSCEVQLEDYVKSMETEIKSLRISLKKAQDESKQMKNINKELLD